MSDQKLREDLKKSLCEMGLTEDEAEKFLEPFVSMRLELLANAETFKKKNLPLSLAISSSTKAIQLVEKIFDILVERKGLLARSMQGENTHDALANVKASIESLLVGEDVQARTLELLKSATQRIRLMKPDQKSDS